MSNQDLRAYLIEFFKKSISSIESESSFKNKIEIMTNMYSVINKNFDFICSDEWSNQHSINKFLEAIHSRILEVRTMIYSSLEVNFDINNPVERTNTYHLIYDQCLNVMDEFEKKYMGDYFDEILEEFNDDWNEWYDYEVHETNDTDPY